MMASERKTLKPAFKMQCAAYHEAGHAVMSFILRRGVTRVTIIPNDESKTLGLCTSTHLPRSFSPDMKMDARARNVIEREVMILLAGTTAERKFRGRHNWRGANDDLRKAVNLASYYCPSTEEVGKYLDWLKERTWNDLCNKPAHWRAVEYIAAELLETQAISGKKAKDLYHKAFSDPFE
jgi:hypothetical protein